METVVIELEQWLLDWLEIAGTVMSRSSSLFVLEHDVAKLLRSVVFSSLLGIVLHSPRLFP
jgi:hypothetical protein